MRCKIDIAGCADLRPKLYYGQEMPPQLTVLQDKRDLTILFNTHAELEAWVAAIVKLQGCPVFVE